MPQGAHPCLGMAPTLAVVTYTDRAAGLGVALLLLTAPLLLLTTPLLLHIPGAVEVVGGNTLSVKASQP